MNLSFAVFGCHVVFILDCYCFVSIQCDHFSYPNNYLLFCLPKWNVEIVVGLNLNPYLVKMVSDLKIYILQAGNFIRLNFLSLAKQILHEV